MAKAKSQSEMADRRSGGYFLLPDSLLASAAWRAASPLAIKVLLVLCSRHNGRNNGRIGLSSRDAAALVGTRNYRAISRAFGELHDLGLAVVEADRPRVERMAREYRLTFVSTDGGKTPATNDYAEWTRPEKGNFGAEDVATETSVSADPVATEAKVSAEGVATDGAKSTRFRDVSAATGSTHIINHEGQSPRSKKNGLEIAGGLVGASSLVVSAAPLLTELRARALRHVAAFGRGSQTRLAGQAGILPGTFSRFLHHDGPLSERARILLACAFPKVEAAERQFERATA